LIQKTPEIRMLYAILCYQAEGAVCAMSREQDDALMNTLLQTQEKLAQQVRFGPVARLMPTTAATTLRSGRESLVLDGPFAETKEQLLGFYVVDCKSLEEAIEVARKLKEPRDAAGLSGALEIRPVQYFDAGA
jgi:hypothetical protein